MRPGEIQVLGVDLYDGGDAEVVSFQDATGASFPLLKCGGCAAGGNLNTLYGPFDNYVIINKQGIVRYNASLEYAHMSRYHLDRMRAAIDSLVSQTVGVDDRAPHALALASRPNPFARSTAIELALPTGGPARITVHDASGRWIATLWQGEAPAGVTRATWDGRGEGGPAPAGVYFIRAEAGGAVLHQRVVRLK